MTDEQFTAFRVVLTAVTVLSVLLLYGMAWDLRNYSKQKGQR